MKPLNLLGMAILLLVLSACGESTTGEQASTDLENNSGTPVALTQLAAEMFAEDEDSTPMDINQMNLDIEEDTPNTIFDDMLPDGNQ